MRLITITDSENESIKILSETQFGEEIIRDAFHALALINGTNPFMITSTIIQEQK